MVCRLCLQNSSEVLDIFNNKGQELKIAMVIGKHFWFEPKNKDPVSSHICHSCWTKLSDFHKFYKYIKKAQQLLTVEVIVETEYKLTACDIAVEDVELASKYVLEETTEEQYEEPFNITSNALADDLKGQFIEKKKNEQSEVSKTTNVFRGSLYSHKHNVQQCDGKYVCNICKKSYKMAKSLKEHMLEHTGLSLYSCPHCSRTFNYISAMHKHRKQKHIKEFKEFRKLRKISTRSKEPIILTISSLSDDTNNSFELPSEHDLEENVEEQYEELYNLTSNALADDFKDQSIDIVNNEKKKDDQDISTIHDDKGNERDLQFIINDKKKTLRNKGTELKRSSERNKVVSLTEEAITTDKGRPCKGEVAPLKNNQQSDGKYVCYICRKSYKWAHSLKEHMSQHSGLSLYRCPHCSRTFNYISAMHKHRKRRHTKQFEEFRKPREISSRVKEIIIPTISSVSDATMNSGELQSSHDLEKNITSDVLAEENYGVIEFEFPPYLKDQSIDIVNNEKKKDDQDITAIHDGKGDGSDVQFLINDKNEILRNNGTELKRPSKRNRVEFLTQKATTSYKVRLRPRTGDVAPLKNKSNSNEEKAAKLRIYNGPSGSNVATQEMPEIINRKIFEFMQLKCDVCGIESDTFHHIRKHMMSAHDVLPYVKCCEKKFYRRASLYDHIKFHLNPDIYKCKKCYKVFSDKPNLRNHNILVHQSKENKIFQCPQCPKKFAKKYLLQTHKTQQHCNVLKYFCPECKRGFSFMSALTSHTVLMHGANETMCDICSKIVKGPAALKQHQLEHQGIVEPVEETTTTYKGRGRARKGEMVPLKNKSNRNKKKKASKLRIKNDESGSYAMADRKISEYMQLKCDVCGIELDTFDHIKNHMMSVHDVRPYVKCCEKKFITRAFLYDHIKFHLNPDIYKCKKCYKVFSDRRNFKNHNIYMHKSADTKIFQCPQCPTKFDKKYLLQTHKTQQHKVLKYFCSECKIGFPFKSSLTSHTAWRHGTMCDICSEIIKGPGAYKRHQLKHQGIVEPIVQCEESSKQNEVESLTVICSARYELNTLR